MESVHICRRTFLGGFQSALFYAPNYLHLVLPLEKAINFNVALHLFILGLTMYAWGRNRGLQPLAALLSSILLALCGTSFLRVFAGHTPNLATAAWVPLLLLAIDKLFEKPSLGWVLTGGISVTLQILAGHPQYVFYTFVAVVVYTVLLLSQRGSSPRDSLVFVSCLAGVYFMAACLSAVQLLTGLDAASEGIRSGRVPYEFAASFSLAPEHLLTFLSPSLFGDEFACPYWGRGAFWEMTLFLGVTGFLLAIYGSVLGERPMRRFSLTMSLILLFLALGGHTPLFRILYAWVPGFDKFRGNCKFVFQASLFLAMLAGIGFHKMLTEGLKQGKTLSFVLLTVGVIAVLIALSVRQSAQSDTEGIWERTVYTVHATGECDYPLELFKNLNVPLKSGVLASKGLLVFARTCFLLAGVMFLASVTRKAVYAVGLLAVIELIVFASHYRPTFEMTDLARPKVEKTLAEDPGDYRIVLPWFPNATMSMKAKNLCGEDPFALRRFVDFIMHTNGARLEESIHWMGSEHLRALYGMLRCKYVFDYSKGKQPEVLVNEHCLPRFLLLQNWNLIQDPNEILFRMSDPSFDPNRTVFLQQEPSPKPIANQGRSQIDLLEESSDHVEIEFDLSSPSILLMTDLYSKGWRVRALSESLQDEYEILRANYFLRAIPLAPGHHRLRIEYLPTAFIVGKWISVLSTFLIAGLLVKLLVGRART